MDPQKSNWSQPHVYLSIILYHKKLYFLLAPELAFPSYYFYSCYGLPPPLLVSLSLLLRRNVGILLTKIHAQKYNYYIKFKNLPSFLDRTASI